MNFKSNLFDKIKKDTIRVAHDEQDAADVIAKELFTSLPSVLHSRPIVFVCIGTDRSTGDSLGPLIGSLLVRKRDPILSYLWLTRKSYSRIKFN